MLSNNLKLIDDETTSKLLNEITEIQKMNFELQESKK